MTLRVHSQLQTKFNKIKKKKVLFSMCMICIENVVLIFNDIYNRAQPKIWHEGLGYNVAYALQIVMNVMYFRRINSGSLTAQCCSFSH